MTKEVIKLALQYIEANAETRDEWEIVASLRQAIAEADKQNEPVAWGMKGEDGLILDVICPDEHAREEGSYTIPLYTHPKEWVGLTDEEKAQFVVAYYPSNWDRKTAVTLMSDYEKYLKEKNT